jgi:hypothetical protein
MHAERQVIAYCGRLPCISVHPRPQGAEETSKPFMHLNPIHWSPGGLYPSGVCDILPTFTEKEHLASYLFHRGS